MMKKEEPCCARLTAKLHHDQNNLRVLAQKAARRDAKGLDIGRYRAMIAAAKFAIAADRASIADHEASHAGQPVSA